MIQNCYNQLQIVTAQPQPQPQHNLKLVDWDTVITEEPPTPPPQHELKLHEKINRALLRKQKLLVYINKA